MEKKVAVISIIVENMEYADAVNELLHQYGKYVIGRMGVPYREKGINMISVAIDAPKNEIVALTDALGRQNGVTAQAVFSVR